MTGSKRPVTSFIRLEESLDWKSHKDASMVNEWSRSLRNLSQVVFSQGTHVHVQPMLPDPRNGWVSLTWESIVCVSILCTLYLYLTHLFFKFSAMIGLRLLASSLQLILVWAFHAWHCLIRVGQRWQLSCEDGGHELLRSHLFQLLHRPALASQVLD